jgi:hypothetical protein
MCDVRGKHVVPGERSESDEMCRVNTWREVTLKNFRLLISAGLRKGF